MTKTSGWSSRRLILPIIVVICHTQMSIVHLPEWVFIANQRTLPMVVEIIPRYGYEICPADDVDLAIVLIGSAGAAIWFEFVVVDPHTCGVLNRDSIVIKDSADFEVLNDYVCDVFDIDAVGSQDSTGTYADDWGIWWYVEAFW